MKSYIVLFVCLSLVVSAYSWSLLGTSSKTNSSSNQLHPQSKRKLDCSGSPTTCPACLQKVDNDNFVKGICAYTNIFTANRDVNHFSSLKLDITRVIKSAGEVAKFYSFRYNLECECLILGGDFLLFLIDGSLQDDCITFDSNVTIVEYNQVNFAKTNFLLDRC